MTMPKPVVGWERRDMIRPLRRTTENRRSTRSASETPGQKDRQAARSSSR
jgi:hypothetical protein